MSKNTVITGGQLITGMTVILLLLMVVLAILIVMMPPTIVAENVYVTYSVTDRQEQPPADQLLPPVELVPYQFPVGADLGDEVILVRKKTGIKVSPEEVARLIWVGRHSGIHWQTLVAQYQVESACGRDQKMYAYDPYQVLNRKQRKALEMICRNLDRDPRQIRCAKHGEIGPFQFLPLTFARYATDGNGDGIADPWVLEDAAMTAAKHLEAEGYKSYAPWTAVARYNAGNGYSKIQGQRYARKVLVLAQDLGAPLGLS